MNKTGYAPWVRQFETNAERRLDAGDPPWEWGAALDPAVVRSLQRFQTGEEGDGASLLRRGERTGDGEYLAALRLFVAEEQNHARMLRLLLGSAGAPTINGHWSDTVFVTVRNALGLRLELMTLMVAEVVALRYYRALRDGTPDPLLTDVAARILADEYHHVAFHVDRLRSDFARWPPVARAAVGTFWWTLLVGTACVVAVDHGPALARLGVRRSRFVRDVAGLFRPYVRQALGLGPGSR